MAKQFLNNAYGLASSGHTKQLYKDWAETYDEEIMDNGYSSPARTAQALVMCGAQLGAPILDVGCGTGVSGLFLKDAGFNELHGSDFSPEMLTLAKEKQLYSELHQADLRDPFEFVKTPFQTIAAIGVLAPGHAGPDIIRNVINLLPKGGLFGFSMNDHTLKDPGYFEEMNRMIKDKKIRVRWQDYGDHLPKINLNSMIMVLERIA
jgi:predicted TPR repeat methyltransferase